MKLDIAEIVRGLDADQTHHVGLRLFDTINYYYLLIEMRSLLRDNLTM
jgi:hypothetical protein